MQCKAFLGGCSYGVCRNFLPDHPGRAERDHQVHTGRWTGAQWHAVLATRWVVLLLFTMMLGKGLRRQADTTELV